MLQLESWWRADPLTPAEAGLLNALYSAHTESSYRPSASSVAVANAAAGSGQIDRAIMAGILALGGKHAPLEETYNFLKLENPEEEVAPMLKRGEKVPGWGGTFQKDQPDPLWEGVAAGLRNWPAMWDRIFEVTDELASHGKNIFPNPSAYTAAVGLVLRIHPKLLVYIFIRARLDAWARIAASQIGG